jgi:type VI secretion system secreted protein VgrG
MPLSSLMPNLLTPLSSSNLMGDLLAKLSSFLTQDTRLIEIDTPLSGANFVVERFTGNESVSGLFSFDIDCLSTQAHLDMSSLIGEEVTLRVLQAGSANARLGLDAQHRTWHGLVSRTAELGADGGLARYRLTIQPWLALLGLRRDSFIFQNKTVLDILKDVFADYPAASYRFEVTQDLRLRSLCTQYRETDLAFMQRLLGEEGLSYRFEHDQTKSGGSSKAGSSSNNSNSNSSSSNSKQSAASHHHLVIFDQAAQLPATRNGSLGSQIRFGKVMGNRSDDTLTQFAEQRQVTANAVSVSSWDHKALVATGGADQSTLKINSSGALPTLEVHSGSGAYRYQTSAAADLHAAHQLAALDAATQHFSGEGSVRSLGEAQHFTLTEHDGYAGRDHQFTVISISHQAANNLGSEAAQLLSNRDLEAGTYRNHFIAQPASAAILPSLNRQQRKPTTPGAQTALVVGLDSAGAGQPTSERGHRVKIQFPWQRGAQPVSGGLSDTGNSADTSGHAPGNDASGTWVRLSEKFAGPNWGSHTTAHIGDEVLVDFIEGDIDRPLIKHFIDADNMPIVAFDGGYGLTQMTAPAPTYEQVWNWKENIKGGTALYKTKQKDAKTYLSQNKRTYTDDQLKLETWSRWNGGSYHVWDDKGNAWVRNNDIVCDPVTGNIGWDMSLADNKDKTVEELHKRDAKSYKTPKSKAATNQWKYTGICYADHLNN